MTVRGPRLLVAPGWLGRCLVGLGLLAGLWLLAAVFAGSAQASEGGAARAVVAGPASAAGSSLAIPPSATAGAPGRPTTSTRAVGRLPRTAGMSRALPASAPQVRAARPLVRNAAPKAPHDPSRHHPSGPSGRRGHPSVRPARTAVGPLDGSPSHRSATRSPMAKGGHSLRSVPGPAPEQDRPQPPASPAAPVPDGGAFGAGGAGSGQQQTGSGAGLPAVTLAGTDVLAGLHGSDRTDTHRSGPVVGGADDPAVAPD